MTAATRALLSLAALALLLFALVVAAFRRRFADLLHHHVQPTEGGGQLATTEPSTTNEDGIEREIVEVADLLRERGGYGFARCWGGLDEVQKSDAVEFLLREAERFAMGNIEERSIERDEYDAITPRDED